MANVAYSSPPLPTDGDQITALALLVDAEGVILASSPASAGQDVPVSGALSAVLRPYADVDFADWWRDLTARAVEQRPLSCHSMALLKSDHGGAQLVILNVAAIAGRDEFLLTCLPAGYRHLSLLNALHSIGVAISRLDLARVLATVRQKVCDLMPVDSFYIALHDKEAGLVHFREVIDDGQFLGDRAITQLPQDGLIGWVLTNRKNLLIGDLQRDTLPAEIRVHGGGEMPRAILLVPLIAHGDVFGALSVQSHEPDIYSEEDLWLLDAIAGQTAVAIHNAFLYEETAGRLATLATLQETALSLSAVYDRTRISEVVAQAVRDLLEPDEVRVYLHDRITGELRYVAGQMADGPTPARSDPEPDALIARLDRQEGPFFLDGTADQAHETDHFDWPPASLAGYPIRRGEQRYGILVLLYKEKHFFRQDEQRTLSLMANQAAIAIENSYYHDDLLRRYEEVSALYALAQQITGQLNSDEILQMVVTTLRDIFDCRACVVFLREGDDVVIRAAVGVKQRWQEEVRFKVGEGVAGRVVATGQSVYVPDVHADPAQLIFDPDVHSLLAVPIVFQNRVMGSINLDSVIPDAFAPEHERILTIAAAQVAAALENARLYQTEAERAEKLAAANRELKNLDKLREELVQNLAHELRTPLTYVKGYSTLLLESSLGELSGEQLDAVRVIVNKSEVLERLISDVVLLEQISEETLEREPLDLNELARQAMEAARMVHEGRGLRFALDLTDEACWVLGDRSRVNQVIDNLLGNAVKFTPAGGTVLLSTQVSPDGTEVQVAVRDTGIGIAPEHLDRIFDRFYQIKDPARRGAGGSGIGLAIVQAVVQAHHGRIWVESAPGQGSVFTFALPRMEGPPTDDI